MQDIRFRNRRRMAWISFYFMLGLGGFMLIYGVTTDAGAERVDKLSFLIGTLFGVLTTIVITYFTTSTITQVNDTQHKTGTATDRGSAGLGPPYGPGK